MLGLLQLLQAFFQTLDLPGQRLYHGRLLLVGLPGLLVGIQDTDIFGTYLLQSLDERESFLFGPFYVLGHRQQSGLGQVLHENFELYRYCHNNNG